MSESAVPTFPSPTVSAASRAEVHLRYLDYFRAVLVAKLKGLPDDELRSSRLPSGWTPLELLKHVTHVEARWLEWGFEGRYVGDPGAIGAGAAGTSPPRRPWPTSSASWRTKLIAAALSSRRTPWTRLGNRGSAGTALRRPHLSASCCTLLQEYARHVGHLDVVRELIDGRVGEE